MNEVFGQSKFNLARHFLSIVSIQNKLRKEDLSLIADIVRMMMALNVSCSNPKRSIETLIDFLAIDRKNAIRC